MQKRGIVASKVSKPLGKPLAWSDKDLESLSSVTEVDKKAANALWHNNAPKKFKNLLDAVEKNDGSKQKQ